MAEKWKWIDAVRELDGSASPPPLDSERAKDLMARALLQPESLTAEEVQDLAASALIISPHASLVEPPTFDYGPASLGTNDVVDPLTASAAASVGKMAALS